MTTHIYSDYLEKWNNEDVLQYFGSWTNNIVDLRHQYITANPFPHIVIDNFLDTTYANTLADIYPNNYNDWYKYCNPIEVKYAFDNINTLAKPLKDYFYILSSNKVLDIFRTITNIPELTYDPYLHGAGLHAHGNRGRLNLHLDYEKHPITGMERQLNVILFLSRDWNTNWGGANELWNSDISQCIKRTEVRFNRAIIFKTNDISYHGIPDIINCPDSQYRKSIAYYYVAPLSNNKTNYRYKAKFVYKKDEPHNDSLTTLYDIRANRRITDEDIKQYAPNWSP